MTEKVVKTEQRKIKIGDSVMGIADIANKLSLIVSGKMIITVHRDGNIEFGENISPDEGKEFYHLLDKFYWCGSVRLIE